MMHNMIDELLKNSFEQYQVMWNKGQNHSHIPHHLGSLLALGASDKQLKDIYDSTMRNYTEEYHTSPHEINKDNWYDSLDDVQFCLAYRNFFDKQLPIQGDWKRAFFEILLDDTKGPPLIDAAVCRLLHPIIHMSYAIELDSRPVACEALTMTAVCCNSVQKVYANLKSPTNGTKRALQIIKDLYSDDNTPHFGPEVLDVSAAQHETFFLSYYNQWQMPDNLHQTMEEFFDMSVYMYGATHKPNQVDFDFCLLHLLTGINAIRKIQPYLDDSITKRILCSFFYASLAMYISQRQPKIDERLIDDYEVTKEHYHWKYVIDRTLHTKLATEPHLVKVICALKDGETNYGSKRGLYLTTAIKTVDHLNTEIPWNYYSSVEPWVGLFHANRELNLKH